MTTTNINNKAIIDGVPRFIAYMVDCDHHHECAACGKHETADKHYYYTDDMGERWPLCHGCVRGETADPRFIWHAAW
jgi:hypothetical protein